MRLANARIQIRLLLICSIFGSVGRSVVRTFAWDWNLKFAYQTIVWHQQMTKNAHKIWLNVEVLMDIHDTESERELLLLLADQTFVLRMFYMHRTDQSARFDDVMLFAYVFRW